ncbi:high-affinity Fe2+/Pb2+ permease [Pseudoclavibacter chungangensis]|uniref:High-affinity Fe2+/Pb2+ permease n=1 Tax=Pseudoclavibacter chungangensis TaxID=587635 RepID=A0A7J5C328_9MICO|nr:iron uptake transporter permease EfeU [Pseudoclavibacter chungangensis]KAB1662602.1 high-affinity Fe2+/Pb2+ permease [Pseudoclavibacter chungangensis]NYJ68651.1 high-affinity iron transporter [Pseudoclavibacter chungangensis]
MLGTLLIGLREGLEASLVVAILLTYVHRIGRRDVARMIWLGVAIAIAVSLGVGAILTFGAYGLSTQAQEIIGGSLSLVAVAMVTWMVFWMLRVSQTLSHQLEGEVDAHLDGAGWGVVLVAFLAVGREGLETALFVWSTTRGDANWFLGFSGAVIGIVVAAGLAWGITRGLMRLDLPTFFRWTGYVLIVVAAGVVAYAVHDLMEGGIIPGPFMAAPDGAGPFVQSWFGDNAWAFRVGETIPPDGFLAALLKGTIGFTPEMTKLELIAWAAYLIPTMTCFIRLDRANRKRSRAAREASETAPAAA